MRKNVVIIGAGMAGCFMALCLAKRGYFVQLYENRPDVRTEPYDSGRSFNLTLYYRGILAMKKANIWDQVRKIAVIAEGNVAHYENTNIYDSFDAQGNEILYTVHRNQLNGALLDVAEQFPNITITFNTKCIAVDNESKTVTLHKMGQNDQMIISADLVIGADGVNSIVRKELQNNKVDTAIKQYEDWGYKEVHISQALTKQLQLRTQATHTWPRPNSLLIAFPNPDESFTLMFNLPLEGEGSFDQLTSSERIKSYIKREFPDLIPLLPEIVRSFTEKPTGKFVTLYAKKWHDNEFMVIIGDASHAVIPFYGQGVCAAFEDCLIFSQLIDSYADNWPKIFKKYHEMRKVNTDLLAELSKENFIELRDKSRSPYYLFKDKADTLLHRLLPNRWLPPLYVLIAHGDMEYQDALKKYVKQQKLSRKVGLDAAIYALSLPFILSNKFQKM